MDEKIKGLWNSNKILFFLLIPIILIFVFRDLIMSILIGSARKVSENAKKEDEQLKSKADEAERQSELEKQKADLIADRIENRKEEDVSEDWHKKK
jgi:zona occludens toxin (predicted ATPase)